MKYWFSSPLWLVGVVVLSCVQCTQAPQIQRITGPAQGSTYNISYWSAIEVAPETLQEQITREIDRIDVVMSNYRNDSVIEQFNQQQSTESFETGSELVQLIHQARQISSQSQGCYDLTIKPLFDLWGFKADKLFQPSAEQIAESMQNVGMSKILETGPSMLAKQQPALRLDVSSIAQGYTVGRLAKILEQAGVNDYLVEVGGELQVRGQKPGQTNWKIAIEKPLPGAQTLQKIIEVKQVEPLSVMTSGTYRHYFDANGQRFSHVLDARLGEPVKHHTVSTTVLMADPTLGDGWSTAFLCLGSQQGKAVADRLGIKVLFIDQHGDDLVEIQSEALQQSKTILLN